MSETVVAGRPLIEARGISKAFGPDVLMRDANLSVYEGETLAVIGESGSGKSVLLKMFIGLVEPDSGSIFYKGEDVTKMDQSALDKLHGEVGYVFQNDALFDSLSILDNIGYALREHTKMSDEEIKARVVECLQMVGLEERILDQHPASLSGGMRKRVGLARAVARKPEIVLYDEPTQGLDPQSITRIAEMISAMHRDMKVTGVIVTHDMRTAFTVADRIALLHDHQFVHVGTPMQFAHSNEIAIREFIAEAMQELQDLPWLAEGHQQSAR